MSAPRRTLVVGASGLLGGAVAQRWRATGEVQGVARRVRGAAARAMDLADAQAVAQVLEGFAPDTVVVAAAWPWVDGCEADPARSHRENVEALRPLLSALRGSSVQLVYYSTDHVFDGTAPHDDESAAVNPKSVYAQHKVEAEGLVLALPTALVLRTSYVFGVEAAQKNFVYQIVRAARSGQPLRFPRGQCGQPTWSGWLADVTQQLVTEDVRGVVHAVGPEVLTKAQWAARIAQALEPGVLAFEEVDPADAGQVAPRPQRVALATRHRLLQHPPLDTILRAERDAFLEGSH